MIARGAECSRMHLFHEAGLAVTVGINLGVELVHDRGLLVTCSALVVAASGVVEVVAVDLAVVVAVSTVAYNTSLGGGAGQVALASHAAVSVGGVGVAASQVLGGDLAVVVAVEGVAGTGVVVGSSVVVAVAGVLVAVGTASLVGKTSGGSNATGTADVLGDTLELVVALLTASKSSALGLELLHGHGWESSSLMVGSLVMVNLMDGDGGVDDVGLDGLLLNNGLDGLVDVVVDVLSANSGGNALAVGSVLDTALVSEASLVVD